MSSPTIPPTCPYCGCESEKVSGDVIYKGRTDLAGKWFYRCQPCDARVGCHPRSDRPLGTLANAELRRLRLKAHELFDPLWKERGVFPKREDAYRWLQMRLGKGDAVHIGEASNEVCRDIVSVCAEVHDKLDAKGMDYTLDWMANVLEDVTVLDQLGIDPFGEPAKKVISGAETQRAKYASDTRWGSW